MLNRVVLVGRLTKDPELRKTNNGSSVASFTLALNRNYNSADGQQADYINCIVWNKLAENVGKYCSEGTLVGVDGRLRSRNYENNQGKKIFVVEVMCDSVQFLETRASVERRQNQHLSSQEIKSGIDVSQPTDLEKELDNSFGITEEDVQL